MKREDLEKLGLSKEQIDSVCDLNNEDVSPLKKELEQVQGDLKVANEKISAQDNTIKELNKDLEEFKDVDVSGLKQKIEELEKYNSEKDEEHKKEIADRDFNDVLKDAISAAHGKNAKAITALLDVDTLKASKNQKDDIAAAIKVLTEAEDSKMLFGEPEAKELGRSNTIGSFSTGEGAKATDTLSSALKERYEKGV